MNDHLSILLPVKNGEKYIQSSLLNLMKSCRVGDEILVVDDYSIDSTSKIVKQMCGEDSRIKLINNRESGIVGALNLGVYESLNSWVARVDVDDKYDLNRFEIQRANLQANTVGIFSDYDFFSESHNFLGTIPSAIDADAVAVSLIYSQRTAHPSILFSKEAVINAGGYRNEDFPAEDLSLWLRMSRFGDLISIPKTLLHYRLSAGSVTGTKRNEAKEMTNKLLADIGINSKNIANLIENFESVIELYKKHPYENERELLIIRDLLGLSKSNYVDTKTSKKIRQLLIKFIPKHSLNLSNFQAIKLLYKEQVLRNKVRKSQI
jgi:glycosyltransferase involved in cell wall biosynthesis